MRTLIIIDLILNILILLYILVQCVKIEVVRTYWKKKPYGLTISIGSKTFTRYWRKQPYDYDF
jgi:hypothetical protein